MTVSTCDGIVLLEGRCMVEDAEALLLALNNAPAAPVDVSAVTRMHMAVAQILLVGGARLRGTPQDPFLARHFRPGPEGRPRSGQS